MCPRLSISRKRTGTRTSSLKTSAGMNPPDPNDILSRHSAGAGLALVISALINNGRILLMKTEIKKRTAKRMQGIQGEAAFETLARANELERQGRSIIHLEIGEPDFDTPEPVVRAGID